MQKIIKTHTQKKIPEGLKKKMVRIKQRYVEGNYLGQSKKSKKYLQWNKREKIIIKNLSFADKIMRD